MPEGLDWERARKASKAALLEMIRNIPILGSAVIAAYETYTQETGQQFNEAELRSILFQLLILNRDQLQQLSDALRGRTDAIIGLLKDVAAKGDQTQRSLADLKSAIESYAEQLSVQLHEVQRYIAARIDSLATGAGTNAAEELRVSIRWEPNLISAGQESGLVFDVENRSGQEVGLLAYYDPSYFGAKFNGVYDPRKRAWITERIWITDQHFLSLLRPGDRRTFHWGRVNPMTYYGLDKVGIWRTQLELVYELETGLKKRTKPVGCHLEIVE